MAERTLQDFEIRGPKPRTIGILIVFSFDSQIVKDYEGMRLWD